MRKLFIVSALLLIFVTIYASKSRGNNDHIFIVATNDIHANIYAMPQLKTLVDKLDESGKVILIDAGDRVSGNAFVDDATHPGVPMIELMNAVGYNVVTLGNHEFDKGQDILKDMVEVAEFHTVCSNVDVKDLSFSFDKSVIIEYGGVKIGFTGVVDTDEDGHPLGDDMVYADFNFSSDAHTAYDMCNTLATECDFVVLLSHMGDNVDEMFIAQSPKCNWVAGGHTHEMRNETINGIQLTQSGKNMSYVMVTDIEICDGEIISTTYTHHSIDEYIADSNIVDMVLDIKSRNPELGSIEGYASELFTHNGVANLTVESLRTYPYADGFIPEVVFYHFGGVRLSTILPGGITRGDIYNNDPFNSVIILGELSAKQMQDFILSKYNSVGADGRKDKESHYPYFRSNTPYNIALDDKGDATEIIFDLDNNKMYKVAVCDYITKKYIDSTIVAKQFRPAGVTVREALLHHVRSFEQRPIVPDNTLHQTELKPNK